MPRKAQSRLLPESRKQQIVETVLDLVEERGTEAVSAQSVADAIGVTQPAVFRHFPTKEALWLAVMNWLEMRLAAMYASASHERSEPALAILGGLFLGHIRLIEARPALAKLVLSDHLRLAHPNLQTRFAAIHQAYTARLEGLIEQAKREGAIRDSVATDDACASFLALIQGLGFQFAIARVPTPLMRRAEFALVGYFSGLMAPGELEEQAQGMVVRAHAVLDSHG